MWGVVGDGVAGDHLINHGNTCDAVEDAQSDDGEDNDGDDGDDGDGGGGGGGGGGGDPGDGSDPNPDCEANPDDQRCRTDCEANPTAPGCEKPNVTIPCEGATVWVDLNGNQKVDPGECIRGGYDPDCDGVWVDLNGNGEFDEGECNPFEMSGGAGSTTVRGTVALARTSESSSRDFVIGLWKDSQVTVSLTGMSRDFDCRGRAGSVLQSGGTTPTRTRSPSARSSWRCSNNGGTRNDSWSGSLAAGTHTVTVWPWGGGTGDYTLTVSISTSTPSTPPPTTDPEPEPDPEPDPPPPALSVQAVSDSRAPSGGSFDTVLPAATGGTAPYVYSVSGLPTGITFVASTRRASGTLPTVTTDTDYPITYTATDSASTSASASVTFTVTVAAPPPAPAPSAPLLSGSVSGRTQTLTWTAPTSGDGITRYQLQTRNSAAHRWRFTGAGVPSPSSNIGSTVRSWSVSTPWTLVRHYRIRATNAVGDGAWSNVVELTTPAAPPPLSVPEISNLRLSSGGTMNRTLPAASGGTSPYTYTLTGLPAGITFVATTRRVSGTLPTVTTDTSHTVTYAVTDSAGMRRSVVFTITVLAPTPPPSAPTLSGSVVRQTQSLSWTAPASASPITRYQMQTRNSAAHSWRFTTAGSPSPSSNFSSSARSWSVTTPARLHRHYRVRATSANGDGAWSNVVELTSN